MLGCFIGSEMDPGYTVWRMFGSSSSKISPSFISVLSCEVTLPRTVPCITRWFNLRGPCALLTLKLNVRRWTGLSVITAESTRGYSCLSMRQEVGMGVPRLGTSLILRRWSSDEALRGVACGILLLTESGVIELMMRKDFSNTARYPTNAAGQWKIGWNLKSSTTSWNTALQTHADRRLDHETVKWGVPSDICWGRSCRRRDRARIGDWIGFARIPRIMPGEGLWTMMGWSKCLRGKLNLLRHPRAAQVSSQGCLIEE